jgi:hypothetical protein
VKIKYKLGFVLNALLCASLLASEAWAGKEAGNGGNVVTCRKADHSLTSIEMLDYYEARVFRGISVSMGDASFDYKQKIDLVLDRLAKSDPGRAERYRGWAKSFMSEAALIPGITLTPIPDSDQVGLPRGCAMEQIAIQKEPQFPQDSRYTISKDLWDNLDEQGKAGLILHEIIYREALGFGHQTSVASRYFHSLIASELYSKLTDRERIKLMQLLPFWTVNVQGFEIDLRNVGDHLDPVFDSSGNLLQARLVPGSTVWLEDGAHSLLSDPYSDRRVVKFYPGGAPQSFQAPFSSHFTLPNSIQIQCGAGNLYWLETGRLWGCGGGVKFSAEFPEYAGLTACDFASFNEKGNLTSCDKATSTQPIRIYVGSNPKPITCSSFRFKNGKLESCTLSSPWTGQGNGFSVEGGTGAGLEFNSDGRIVKASIYGDGEHSQIKLTHPSIPSQNVGFVETYPSGELYCTNAKQIVIGGVTIVADVQDTGWCHEEPNYPYYSPTFFYENGKVKSAFLIDPTFSVQNQNVNFWNYRETYQLPIPKKYEFYENGSLKAGSLRDSYRLMTKDGIKKEFRKHDGLEFDEQGLVIGRH